MGKSRYYEVSEEHIVKYRSIMSSRATGVPEICMSRSLAFSGVEVFGSVQK